VFEQKPDSVGVVSFITAASYLRGDAFVGMRELMRRLCIEIWIIDLGGEGRGPRKSENVFNIQTPVAIAIALRDDSQKDPNAPARVWYTEITGTRRQKLRQLSDIQGLQQPSVARVPLRLARALPSHLHQRLHPDASPGRPHAVAASGRAAQAHLADCA
jgi:predicted helicase